MMPYLSRLIRFLSRWPYESWSSIPPPRLRLHLRHTGIKLNLATDEINKASTLLSEARAGIRVNPYNTKVIPVTQTVSFLNCAEGERQTATYDTGNVLHVYYVDDLGDATRGITCTANQRRPYDVIYVSADLHSPTTFIHELGHALGLTLPSEGHSNVLADSTSPT